MKKHKQPTQRMRALKEHRESKSRELADLALQMERKIGTEADAKLLAVLEGNGLLQMPGSSGVAIQASPQMIAAIRLGLQRSGRLVERVETTDVQRPLREASEAELIAELEERDGAS